MPVDSVTSVPNVPPLPNAAPGTQPRQELPGSGQTPPPALPGSQPSTADLAQAVGHLNGYVQNMQRELEFRVDRQTHRVIVTVVDSRTHEVIRQIPSEEVLAIAHALDGVQGLIVRTKA
ncbi:MAG: flagellar protein FlaG [Gammaproteobacteria bacterium]|nr:flagellar protein FlaG [Gammaproteobacteria bacterium]